MIGADAHRRLTFLRHPCGQDVPVPKRALKPMPPSARQRSLTSLIQDVGRDYLRRLLPPAWLALAILAAACTWMALSAHDLIALSALAIALGGLLVNWPRRNQRAWPLWRTLALALAASARSSAGLGPARTAARHFVRDRHGLVAARTGSPGRFGAPVAALAALGAFAGRGHACWRHSPPKRTRMRAAGAPATTASRRNCRWWSTWPRCGRRCRP